MQRIGAIGSLATAVCTRGPSNSPFSFYYYFVILLPIKYPWKTRYQLFTVPQRRVFIYAEVNSMGRHLRCRLFSRSIIEVRMRKPAKAFRTINSRRYADRKEKRKFIRNRSTSCVGRPLCKLFSARA